MALPARTKFEQWSLRICERWIWYWCELYPFRIMRDQLQAPWLTGHGAITEKQTHPDARRDVAGLQAQINTSDVCPSRIVTSDGDTVASPALSSSIGSVKGSTGAHFRDETRRTSSVQSLCAPPSPLSSSPRLASAFTRLSPPSDFTPRAPALPPSRSRSRPAPSRRSRARALSSSTLFESRSCAVSLEKSASTSVASCG